VKKVLMLADGSDNSIKALKEAAKLLETSKPKVTLLTVMEEPVMPSFWSNGMIAPEVMVPPPSGLSEELLKVGEEILRKGQDILGKRGLSAEGKVAFGHAATEILREAKQGSYDLIVLGGKGRSESLSDFLIGSVSSRVAAHAACSVLIVR